MNIVVTVRAVIIHNRQLLMCRHNEPNRQFYNLPGGKLVPGETIEQGIIRELTEETGIAPLLGKILFINQFIDTNNHRIEFFLHITNDADYVNFDPLAATHAHEVSEFHFGDPTDPIYDIRPSWLAQRFQDILERPGSLNAESITSA